MQILIAEDNIINQKLVDLICRKAGYQTRIVPDGEAAVEAMKDGGIQLVLMDVMMPRMDGIEATRQVVAEDLGRVVIVTTSNRAPDELYKDGLNRHLFLPFIDMLKDHLEVHELDSARDHRMDRRQGDEVSVRFD